MGLYTTFDEVGIKESFSELISNISPTYTPFLSGIGTVKIGNTIHQWLEDQLDTVGVNSQVQGFVAVPDTLNPPVLRNNITQIFAKTIQVSDTENSVALHGRTEAFAYEMAKKAKSIKRDLENALVGTKQTMVSGSKTTATMFNGVQAQIPAAGTFGTGGASTPLNETELLNALEYTYNNGAEPTTVLVNPVDAITVASFAQAAGKYRTINDGTKTVTNAVTLYASPFGDVKITIDRFLAPGDSLVYDPEMFKLLVLRNWKTEELAKTGDSDTGMIVGEFSVAHMNQAASAIIRRM